MLKLEKVFSLEEDVLPNLPPYLPITLKPTTEEHGTLVITHSSLSLSFILTFSAIQLNSGNEILSQKSVLT